MKPNHKLLNLPKSILAIDTSTHHLSISLFSDNVIYQTCHQVEKHANAIIDSIDHLCRRADIKLHTVDTIVVNHGPGSFTGLRVGLATAQALAHANQQSIVMISNCALHAYQYACTQTDIKIGDQIAIMLDAKLSQVYFTVYELDEHRLPAIIVPETVIHPEAVDLLNENKNTFKYGSGWQVYEKKNSKSRDDDQNTPATEAAIIGDKTIEYSKINNQRDKLAMSSILIDYVLTLASKQKLSRKHVSECKPNYLRHHVADTIEERARKKKTDSKG